MGLIYLDNASTKKPYKEVVDAFDSFSLNLWANPSNIYSISQLPKDVLKEARASIAETLGCKPNEIYFTSGASEGNAWGCIQRDRVWASAYEHTNYINNEKVRVVGEDYLENFEHELHLYNTVYAHILVSNETGEIFNVAPKFKKAHEYGMFTLMDMTQAYGCMPINIYDYDCDMAVASAHKFGGLRGTGFVFIKEGTEIKPLIVGSQQNGVRGGTENVAGYYAMSIASGVTYKNLSEKILHCGVLRSIVKEKLAQSGVEYIINEGEYNITSTINFALKGIESETIQALLSDEFIYIGTGSACCTGDFKVSETLEAMGVSEDFIHGPIRLSFSLETKAEDVEKAMDRIIEIYKELTNG